jgi:flagellar protein FlbT
MSGLVLKLGPKERVLVNGVVIENGDRRSRLNIVTPGAKILRLRDALHPSEANTPFRRVCYILQLVLSGDVTDEEGTKQATRGLAQLSDALRDTAGQAALGEISALVTEGKFYPALKQLRGFLPQEEQLLRA